LKKQIGKFIAACIILTTCLLIFGACGSSSMSGTYVSANEDSTRLVFDGNNVILYEDGNQRRSGTYRISGRDSDFLVLVFDDEEVRFWLRDNRNTIHYSVMDGNISNVGEVAFIRE